MRPDEETISAVLGARQPRDTELDGPGATVIMRAIPLRPTGEHAGGLVLLRDVTELRRRDRELVTKDATIREIHHRVKNNLQTVAALLRLQARRIDVPEGRLALDEAVRRVGAIAVVHETLSQNFDENVEFDEVADRLTGPRRRGRLARGAGPDPPRRLVRGDQLRCGDPAGHGVHRADPERRRARLPGRGDRLHRRTQRARGGQPALVVEDDGVGLPPGFDVEATESLGLSIVRTLVGELGGRLTLGARAGGPGTCVQVGDPSGEVSRRRLRRSGRGRGRCGA